MTDEKRRAVMDFLAAFEAAQPLFDMVVEAHANGHPAYQSHYVDIAPSLKREDMHTARLKLQNSTQAWAVHLERCCVKQRRLRLLTPPQVG